MVRDLEAGLRRAALIYDIDSMEIHVRSLHLSAMGNPTTAVPHVRFRQQTSLQVQEIVEVITPSMIAASSKCGMESSERLGLQCRTGFK
jgi:hypothetical protein